MDETRTAQAETGRIAQLLDDVRELAPAPAWERVEELLQRMLALQREGLTRLLAHARAAGADDRFEKKLDADELVSSLLLLHGLHPVPPKERVRRALSDLRPQLSARGAHAELLAVADGTVRVAYAGPANGLQDLLRRALEDAAPDVRVEIDAPSAEPLVSLGVSRSTP